MIIRSAGPDWQRRQSGLKSGGVVDLAQQNFDFSRQISEKFRFFQAISPKISIFKQIWKNIDFSRQISRNVGFLR